MLLVKLTSISIREMKRPFKPSQKKLLVMAKVLVAII